MYFQAQVEQAQDREALKLPRVKSEQISISELSPEDSQEIYKNYKVNYANESILKSHLYSYYGHKFQNNNDIERQTWLKSLNAKEALELIKEASQDSKYESNQILKSVVAEIEQAISSPELKKIQYILSENLKGSNLGHAVVIHALGEDEAEKILNIIQSNSFQEYAKKLEEQTGVSVLSNITYAVSDYEKISEGKSVLSDELISALKLVREVLPEIKVDSVEKLWNLQVELSKLKESNQGILDLDSFKDQLVELKKQNEMLDKYYSFQNDSLDVLFDFKDTFRVGVLTAENKFSQEIFTYIKKNYPDLNIGEKVPFVFLNWDVGFAKGYALPILEKFNSSPEAVDKFLAIFGTDMSKVNLSNANFDLPRMNVINHIEDLIEDKKFIEFIDSQLVKYPLLKENLTMENIVSLVYAYENQEKYLALQEARASVSSVEMPDFNLRKSEKVIEIIEVLKEQNYPNLIIDSNSLQIVDDSAIDNLRAEETRKVYDLLMQDWGLENIKVDDFLALLRNKESLSFFTNSENLRKYKELNDIYHFDAALDSSSIFGNLEFCGVDLINKYQQLNNKDIAHFLSEHQADIVNIGPDNKLQTNLYYLANYKNLKLLDNFEEYSSKIAEIESTFDIPKEKSLRYFDVVDVTSESLKESFNWLKNDLLKNTIIKDNVEVPASSEEILSLALTIHKTENYKDIIKSLDGLGLSTKNPGVISYAFSFIAENKEFVEALGQEKFIGMVSKIDQQFFHGQHDVSRLLEYCELYLELKHQPKKLEALLSDDFQSVSSTIGKMFQVATNRPSTLLPMLRVAEDFDQNAMESLIGHLRLKGEKIFSNDIILLSEITKNPNLSDLLNNREQMIKELGEMYQKKSFPRIALDQLNEIPASNENTPKEERERREAEREKIIQSYTERPALNELSNLQLLRLTLIYRSLQSEGTLSSLGRIAALDIEDKSTEWGGTIVMDKGVLSLKETTSLSNTNGGFVDQKYKFFMDGISTFHLHALEIDESNYTGPSGWLGMSAVDIGVADQNNSVDTVFTAMGHPLDSEGKPITSQLRMNADTYYIDKRDPNQPKLRIIDMGEFIVPYQAR